jgi:TPR repeat protein
LFYFTKFKPNGKGLTMLIRSIKEMIHEAGESTDGIAEHWLGELHRTGTGGAIVNFNTAAMWYDRAAEKGCTESMAALGAILATGATGVTRDYEKARFWLREAANRGNVAAMLNLVALNDVLSRDAPAFYWLCEAAKRNQPTAIFLLGEVYEKGQYGQSADKERAVACWQAAANLGNVAALARLGVAYLHGTHGLLQCERCAKDYLGLAACAGNVAALFALGALAEAEGNIEVLLHTLQFPITIKSLDDSVTQIPRDDVKRCHLLWIKADIRSDIPEGKVG